MNKIYLTTVNDKKFEEWRKKLQKKLKGAALEHFVSGYSEVVNGSYLPRAAFVCYWEIYGNGSLAKLAPAMTQASLIHLLHRFIEMGAEEEIEVVSMMMQNFLRLLSKLDGGTDEEE